MHNYMDDKANKKQRKEIRDYIIVISYLAFSSSVGNTPSSAGWSLERNE